MVHNELLEYLVLLRGPFGLVAAQLLNEQPSLVALSGVFGRHYFCNLLPIIIVEVLHELRVLHHEGKETILKQMSLVVLPLGQSAKTLRWVLLLFEQFVEYLHGLLIGNNALSIELVLSILEPDHVFQIATGIGTLPLAAFSLVLK